MDSTVIGLIIGGLITILTLFVTKGFDYLFQERSHNFQLKKELFLKKVNSYEKFTTLYVGVNNLLYSSTTLLEKFLAEKVRVDATSFEKMYDGIIENYNKILINNQEAANAIELYIDLNNEDSSFEIMDEYWQIITVITTTMENVKDDNERFNSFITPEEFIGFDDRLKNNIAIINKSIADLKLVAKKIKDRTNTHFATLKSDLSKYS